MQKQSLIVALVLLCLSPCLSAAGYAQNNIRLSLKTHPVQWLYGFRPNINVEICFNERHALTAEFMWKTKIWRSLGGEVFPSLRRGKGIRMILGARYYFPRRDETDQRDWFVEFQLRYDRKRANFILDTRRSIAALFGKQFYFGPSWGMDQYLGLSLYHWKTYYEKENTTPVHPKYPRPAAGSGIFFRPLWGGLLNYYAD